MLLAGEEELSTKQLCQWQTHTKNGCKLPLQWIQDRNKITSKQQQLQN